MSHGESVKRDIYATKENMKQYRMCYVEVDASFPWDIVRGKTDIK